MQSPRWTVHKMNPSPAISMALVLFALFTAAPSRIHSIDFRGSDESLVIRMDSNSPAFAAFQDAQIEAADFANTENTMKSIPLRVSALSHRQMLSTLNPQLNSRLISQPVLQQSDLHTPSAVEELEGLHISLSATPVAGEPAEMVITRTVDRTLMKDNGDLKSVAERKQILAQAYAQTDLGVTSWKQKLADIVEREKPKAQEEDNRRQAQRTVAQNKNQPQPHEQPLRHVAAKSVDEEEVTAQGEEWSLAANKVVSAGLNQRMTLTGNIVLGDGLAFVGSETDVRLFHTYAGDVNVNKARIWLNEGRFEIEVARLAGHVIAEIRDREERLIGMGEIDLLALPQIPYLHNRIENLHMKIRSFNEGILADITSVYSQESSRVDVPSAKLVIDGLDLDIPADASGHYRTDVIDNESYFVASAEAPGHVSTMQLVTAGHPINFIMYPEKWIDALVRMIKDVSFKELRRFGMLIGQVEVNGKPVAGAKVEIAGTGMPQPIYFQSILPNHKLSETDESGKFVVIGLEPGLHAVRALYKNRYFPVEIVPVDQNHVTNMKLTDVGVKNVQVKLVDPYTIRNSDQPMKISAVGSSDVVTLTPQQTQTIQIPGGEGLMIVENDPVPEYEVVRMMWSRKEKSFSFPRVEREWLQNLLRRHRISVTPGAGLVLGFSTDRVPAQIREEGAKTVYFDRQGTPVSFSDPNRAGFLIYDVSPGAHQVFLQPADGRKIRNYLVLADQGVTNVIFDRIQY